MMSRVTKKSHHKYTEEQDEFIRNNFTRNNFTNVSECLIKFNKEFGTELTYSALKSHANRKLKITTGYRPWTNEMNQAIAEILISYPYKISTEIFNEKFGTNFTRKQVQEHCVTVGISRRHSEKLKQVDKIIKEHVEEKNYGEIREIINSELEMGYTSDVTVCRRANNLGMSRPHRVWQKTDKKYINGEEVTQSEYVRFIGNRWHRLTKEIQSTALMVVKLQSELANRKTLE